MPVHLLLPNNTLSAATQGSPDDYAVQTTSKLQSAFTLANQVHIIQKLHYDRRVKYIPTRETLCG